MIKIVAAAVLVSFHFIELSKLGQRWKLPTKPFQCGVCLPVWIAAGLYWVPVWIIDLLIVSFSAPVVYIFFRNLFININRNA